jgi:hypothetical protein
MEDFSSLLGGGGGGGGSGGGGGGSGKSESSSASATSGNNFGGSSGFLTDQGTVSPLGIIGLAALGLFAFLALVIIARK